MSARDSITALICGYPASVRRTRRLAMYVSFIDESGKGGPVFVVSGLTAKADPNWLNFSDGWADILAAKPVIPHFHLADKQGLSDEEHWRKIDSLIRLTNRCAERGDALAIHVDPYKDFFRGKIGVTYDSPFQAGYVCMFQQCALRLPDPDSKVDFVFDQMSDTEYLEVLTAYRAFKLICPDPAARARFGQEPIRQSDESVLPLQAADLLAGLFRRAYEEKDARARVALKQFSIPIGALVLDAKALEELFSKSDALTPGLALGLNYEDRKMRSKRLRPLRDLLREQDE
jgi:hypothetical protein